jgi:hypothetical protein
MLSFQDTLHFQVAQAMERSIPGPLSAWYGILSNTPSYAAIDHC